MSENSLKSSVEALIFASGDPLETDKICEILNCTADEVEKSVNEIRSDFEKCGSALSIVKLKDSWQMTTLPRFAKDIRTMLDIQRNSPLSPAAFEVLAVVAYNQPVTRSFVEQVRGVDCSGVMSSLVEKGLIEERGRLELPGRPLIYGTTQQFMRCFSLEDLADLPPLPEKEDESANDTNSAPADEQKPIGSEHDSASDNINETSMLQTDSVNEHEAVAEMAK